MKRFLLIVFAFFTTLTVFAQKINGQWRGYFDDNGNIGFFSGDNTEYVLELDIEGSTVRGSSYSYFSNRRYYVICSLSGTYDKKTKTLKVTETARVKGLTPPDWSDCLQTHVLTYKKENGVEELEGKWIMAPGQTGNCGHGSTVLTRKTLSRTIASFNKQKNAVTPFSAPKQKIFADNTKPTGKIQNPAVKNIPKEKPPVTTPETPDIPEPKEKEIKKEIPEPIIQKSKELSPEEINLTKRNNNVLKTIEIENENFDVALYDNGEIDGDSVSLFYNGKLLLAHKRLNDKPIRLTLDATTGRDVNELTMYADNLGSIPPNTALMIVTDGDKRYEVRIYSDLQKSGTIRFVHKSKKE